VRFPGAKDAKQRADCLAYLKQVTRPGGQLAQPRAPMGGGAAHKLKTLDVASRVHSIAYCRDTYKVTTADSKTRDFCERNLCFKTDSSDDGPEKGAPAILHAGVMGARASVIFAAPDEISRLITHQC